MIEKVRKTKENIIFEGRIREIEEILIEFKLEEAEFNEQSNKIALIIVLLTIHGRLTQGQLKILTKFSISTISTTLEILVNIGYVRKEMVRGTHEYIYYLSPSTDESLDDVLGSTKPELQYFEKKSNELDKDVYKDKKGLNLLSSRLNEAIRVFKLYHKILEFIANPEIPLEIETYNDLIKGISKEDIDKIDEKYDPEIKMIEDDIINFCMYESAYSTMSNKPTNMIYIYFLLRKVLTQEKLRALTGLSHGKVSQVIRKLMKKAYLEKLDKNILKPIVPEEKNKKSYYSITSILTSFMKSGVRGLKGYLKWQEQFREIKSELESREQELKSLNGYNEIYKTIEKYLSLMKIYQKACNLFLKFI